MSISFQREFLSLKYWLASIIVMKLPNGKRAGYNRFAVEIVHPGGKCSLTSFGEIVVKDFKEKRERK
jgi:hypothetical protein